MRERERDQFGYGYSMDKGLVKTRYGNFEGKKATKL